MDHGPGGFFRDVERIKNFLPGYEFRPGQLSMAEAVLEAFSDDGTLLVEAPSGTGKSLAYLYAAMRHVGRTASRVVISTYTKTLQNQLYYKDLPLLEKITGDKADYALCVGSDNYICRMRLDQEKERSLAALDGSAREAFLEWVGRSRSGLLMDLDTKLPSNSQRSVVRDRRTCRPGKCPFRESCFYLRSRRRVKNARIIIANHSVVFTDIAKAVDILPEEYALLLDEAHTVEDVARDKFSDELSISMVSRYLDRAFAYLEELGREALSSGARECAERLHKGLAMLEEVLAGFREKAERIIPEGGNIPLVEGSHDPWGLYGQLELNAQLWQELDLSIAAEDDIEFMPGSFLGWTKELMRLIDTVFRQSADGRVHWQGRREYGRWTDLHFHSTVLEVSEELDGTLFGTGLARVMTSATMTTASPGDDPFGYIISSLGVRSARTLLLPEVFDHERSVYFCLPKGLADPRNSFERYRQQIVQYVEKVHDLVRGGTFVLFTSYELLEHCAENLSKKRPDIPILRQGELPRYVLLDVFKSRKQKSVLMGTTSFWQGVDVSGEALQAVVITRLPFEVPTDPVVRMRIERFKRAGRNAFSEYQLPRSVIMFKQGFGRLIRGRDDTGVVIVLDTRIRTKAYGRKFLESLPQVRVRDDLSGVKAFLEKKRSAEDEGEDAVTDGPGDAMHPPGRQSG